MLENVTIHAMVRDEAQTVLYSLMSVLPYVKHALIVDTGSTDGTLDILRQIVEYYRGEKDIRLHEFQLPDSTKWSCNKRPEANRKLADCRKWMVNKTDTKFVWVLDGDEVYSDAGAEAVIKEFQSWPTKRKCAYVPLLWFAIDRFNLIKECNPVVYPCTGRLFVREGLSVEGIFPGELHSYDGVSVFPGMRGVDVLDIPPMYHYELATKPWRRELFSTELFTGPQPEVFERYGANESGDKSTNSDTGFGQYPSGASSQIARVCQRSESVC